MSEIPSDIASSAAGAPIQSREVTKEKAAARAGQAHAANQQVRAVDDVSDTVETTDNDTQVFVDSEGTGSQGRESPEEPPEQEDNEPSEGGVTRGDDGQLHVDLEA